MEANEMDLTLSPNNFFTIFFYDFTVEAEIPACVYWDYE